MRNPADFAARLVIAGLAIAALAGCRPGGPDGVQGTAVAAAPSTAITSPSTGTATIVAVADCGVTNVFTGKPAGRSGRIVVGNTVVGDVHVCSHKRLRVPAGTHRFFVGDADLFVDLGAGPQVTFRPGETKYLYLFSTSHISYEWTDAQSATALIQVVKSKRGS